MAVVTALPALLLVPGPAAGQRPNGPVAVGDTFDVGGCSAKLVGCYWDQGGRKGCLGAGAPAAGCTPADEVRDLPYAVPGSYTCAQPKFCKTTPNLPHYDQQQASNAHCAAACNEWDIPGKGSVFYSAMQDGYACMCGTAEDAARTVTESNKAAFSQCSNPCASMSKPPTSVVSKTPAGLAGEMCGGPWLNEVVVIDCTWRHWGWKFLALMAVCVAVYVGAGVYGPARAARQT